MTKRVLLVDDDVELSGMFKEYLEQEGMTVVAVHDGLAGVEASRNGGFDIAVLDVMMPGIDGMEALRRIRAFSRLPILMLTARGDEVDCVVGLELGADDYVSKPCTPRELAARLRAILRRAGGDGPAEIVTAGPLTMWPQERRAQWQEAPLELTSTEYSLLELLARNAGRPVSKAELSDQALGRPLERYDRSIDVHMSSIRHKLGGGDGRSWIQTIRGHGYQFVKI